MNTFILVILSLLLIGIIVFCSWKSQKDQIDAFFNNNTSPLPKNWKRPTSLRQCNNRATFGTGTRKYNCGQFGNMRGGEAGQRRFGLPANMQAVQKGEVCYLDPTTPELKDQLKDEKGAVLSQPMCVTDERLKQLVPCDKYTRVINNMTCGDFSQLNTFTQRQILGSWVSTFPEAPPGGICYSDKLVCEIDKSAAENKFNSDLLDCDLDYKFSDKKRVRNAVDRTCQEWGASTSSPAGQRRLGLPSKVRPVKKDEICWNQTKNQCQELPVGTTEQQVRDAQRKALEDTSSATVPSVPEPVESSPVVEQFMRYL
jgi:hypothetical protein